MEFDLQLCDPHQPQQLIDGWNLAEPIIEAHSDLWDGLYTMDHFRQFVAAGLIQLWLLKDGEGNIRTVLLAQFTQYPARVVLEIILACGDSLIEFMKNDVMAAQVVEQCALRSGVDMSLVRGRVGWKRPLKELGYDVHHVVYGRRTPLETMH